MAIELMLLAVNLNFIAFSHYLGDLSGQVSCSSSSRSRPRIGHRLRSCGVVQELNTIDVEDLDSLKG
jgi:NADH-quinone oxidoreductase subunit K